jgi:hypothetical protein
MVLENNLLIGITLTGIESEDDDIFQDIDYSFSTTFDPLYSTPNKIRAVAGSYIKDISDSMLLYLIHTYSVQADNISICDHDTFSKWEYYAGLWVTYNVALDATLNSDMYVGQAGQKIYKKLGDFAISKDATSKDGSPTEGMITKLECEILKLAVSVRFCREPLTTCDKSLISNDLRVGVPAQLVVKGEALIQPGFGRTFYGTGHHPGMTGYVRILDRYRLTNYNPNCN